jgi:hypothetical protein
MINQNTGQVIIDPDTLSYITTIAIVVIFLVILAWAWATDPASRFEREEREYRERNKK